MKNITIHYTTPYIGTIAKQGEHNQTELVFYLPDSFNGADFVNAEFVKRDGSTSVVDQLIPNNGTVTVPLTQDLTNVDGKMEIQLVAYNVDGTEITEIAKSGIYTCKIRKSLNILYGEDQPGVIERILAFISYWAEKLPDMLAKKHWHTNKDILDTITEDSFGGSPNWNENDTTSKDYINGRTHWLDDNNEYHPLSNNYLSNEANDAIDKRHTHPNKPVLDSFSEYAPDITGTYNQPKYNDRLIGQYPIVSPQPSTQSGDYTFYMYPYVYYKIGDDVNTPRTITVLGFWDTTNSQSVEYLMEFYSGNDPSNLTPESIFPSEVQFAEELTIEANKRYQISIVNNIALWCAVDVEAEEEEE